jgi:penicillin amidase
MTTIDTPRPPGRRWLRALVRGVLAVVGLLIFVVMGGALWLGATLRGSLPILVGERPLAGLHMPVRVERDAHGVPVIRGATRDDVARATGYVHAQERFFQMDLQRRSAAGELAALVGPAVVGNDRSVRLHRFRDVARRVLETAPPAQRALIDAYTAGVNTGLAALRQPPFEYLALRATPEPWREEDSVLVILAMFLELQDDTGARESTLGVMHDTLPAALFDFLAPRGTEWDAPIVGAPIATPPIPGPDTFDLRHREPALARRFVPARMSADQTSAEEMRAEEVRAEDWSEGPVAGSNNWAVAGRLTSDGGALVANDMHLPLRVPIIWYRAALVWTEAAGERRVTGVTLPGVPVVVTGSTGTIAWAFTNTHADWSDVVEIAIDPSDPGAYRTPDGPRRFEHAAETIHVKGQPDQTLEVVSTIWGPVIGKDRFGRPRVLRWVAHDPEATNFALFGLESAAGLDDALAVAATSGIPAQNFVCADATGRIGWTVAGRIPRRVGFDGRLPGSWADGKRRWDGWLRPEEYPRVVDPPSGRIWTANARVVDGRMYALLGDGGYDVGARAGQIRDDLMAIPSATPEAMLAVQLDDQARFLSRWRDLLLAILTPEATAGSPPRAEARRLVETTWTGHASIDSVAYRIVKGFRSTLATMTLDAITAPCTEADASFHYSRLEQREGPLWRLVSERPEHLLDPRFHSWEEQMLAALDTTIGLLTRDGTPLALATWGRRNVVRIQHPLSLAVPRLSAWLDVPPEPLPGDDAMPRVQSTDFGASERFVVSPGHEERGLFQMPGGESGHPLSPWYHDGYAAWARGEPAPFLPGAAAHVLVLIPTAHTPAR